MLNGMPLSRKNWADVAHKKSYHPMLPVLARLLEHAAASPAAGYPPAASPLDGIGAAAVSVKDYVIRLCKYSHCSPAVFIHMLALIDRMGTRHALTQLNIHRVIAAAFVVAAKLTDDEYFGASYYASITGVDVEDLNEMECIFLREIDWNLHCSAEQYNQLQMYLSRQAPQLAAQHAAAAAHPPQPPHRPLRSAPPQQPAGQHGGIAAAARGTGHVQPQQQGGCMRRRG